MPARDVVSLIARVGSLVSDAHAHARRVASRRQVCRSWPRFGARDSPARRGALESRARAHTHAHAQPYGQPLVRRIVWTCFIVLALIGFISAVTPVVRDYEHVEVASLVSFKVEPHRFPAVTVCPVNQIKCTCDAWRQIDEMYKYSCAGSLSLAAYSSASTNASFAAAGWDVTTFFEQRNASAACGTMAIGNRSVTTADMVQQWASGSIDGQDMLIYGGYHWRELVSSCFAFTGSVDCRNDTFWRPEFINAKLCWTINGADAPPAVVDAFTVDRSGQGSSLELVLRHNIPTLTTADTNMGGSVILHAQDVSPQANANELFIEPRKSYEFAYARETSTLLNDAHNEETLCHNSSEAYSVEQCLSRCDNQIVR